MILITGASSGLGAALALRHAAPGQALALSGRDGGRLEQVAERCRAKGAQVLARVADVTDPAAMAAFVADADAVAPLRLVIANAGISAGTGGGGESDAQTRAIFATNLDGVLNTALPALALMRPRRRGQLALVSSLAGFRGLPGAPAYCASKAAVRVWGEALRGEMQADGIVVSVVCPGFVTTPMTDVNDFPMPFLMDADKAADIIARGLAKGKGRIAFPWPTYGLAWLLAAAPAALVDWLSGRLPRKG